MERRKKKSSVMFMSMLLLAAAHTASALNPIVLIPGDGGSQLEARINKPSAPGSCNKTSDGWFPLWVDLYTLEEEMECWKDNVELVYDEATRTTGNKPGVEIRTKDFGNTTSIEWLDAGRDDYAVYFGPIVDHLVETMGYVRGISIHGAPYDFRKAPNEHGEFYQNFKTLIETTYKKNGKNKVILMGHSMGCPMTLYFLNHQKQEWKDKYIRSFVTLSGPWGGTVKSMAVYVQGTDLNSFGYINQYGIRDVERTFPSLFWMFPSFSLWNSTEVIVHSDKVNMTIQDLDVFIQAYNVTAGLHMYEDTKDLIADLEHPGVDIHCIHGHGDYTKERLTYDEFPNDLGIDEYNEDEGDGDGTVNLRSLTACKRWETNAKHKFAHRVLDTDHSGVLKKVDFIHDLVLELTEESNEV